MDRWEADFGELVRYPRFGDWAPEVDLSFDVPALGSPEGLRFEPVYGAPEPYTFGGGEGGVRPERIVAEGPEPYRPGASLRSAMAELQRPLATQPAQIGEASSLITSLLRLGFAQPSPAADVRDLLPDFGQGASSAERFSFRPQIGKESLSESINRLLTWGMSDGETGRDAAQGTGAPAGQAGGKWAVLDGMSAGINNAARMTGVPANLIKSVLSREGSGGRDWGRPPVYLPDRGTYVLPFNGVLQSTAASRGFDWNRMQTDRDYAIWAVGKTLADIKAEQGFTDWTQVAAYYFAGPNWNRPDWSDEMGNTVQSYLYHPEGGVITNMNALDAMGGGPGAAAGGSGGGWFSSALWGGANAPITYEFGAESVNGDMYLYGQAHGTNGWVHPGIDVGVPRGTTLYAAQAGTVSCVGSASAGVGGTGGGTCGFFPDEQGGVGNVTIRFDDGTYLVYGHSSRALVQVGQRVSAGQAVAISGGLQGDHVHFEYRVPGGCPSGYCVQDPRGAAGASVSPSGGGGTRTASQRWWY